MNTAKKLVALLVVFSMPAGQALAGRTVGDTTGSLPQVLTINGGGFGHGVGMSQYGAYGLALHGSDYRSILAHYYTGTEVADSGTALPLRILLASAKSLRVSGATRAGSLRLKSDQIYGLRAYGTSQIELRDGSGNRLGLLAAPLTVSGSVPVKLFGKAGNGVSDGTYRGRLEFRIDKLGGLNAVNVVDIESYLRGVVPAESPASWPTEALKAQAVAARGYALTSKLSGSAGYNLYPDTRSQMYKGVAGERPSTDAAVAATAGEVVTYSGKPVTTFFFSTSGGKTEDVENSFIGSSPQPYLKSVDDPYDDLSPKHRWKITMPLTTAESKLAGLVKGDLEEIKVTKRGRSPRVVSAVIVGSDGDTTVSGPTLVARLGLYDSWAYFRVS